MTERLEFVAGQVLEHLTPRRVLEIINYRTDTILEQETNVKSFCPVHQELVFRTLIIDPQAKRFKCSYSLCPGNQGGDLIDLYALAKKVNRQEAVQQILTHLPISVDWDQETASPAASVESEAAAAPGGTAEAPGEPAGKAAEAPRDPLAEANALLEQGRWGEAEQAYAAILAREPKRLRALVGWAQALEALGRRDELASLYPRIIAGALAQGEVTVAQAFFRRHCEAAATVSEILAALETLLEPSRQASSGVQPLVEALLARAERCEAQGDYAAALSLYRAAEPLAPAELDLSGCITHLLCQMGQTEEALALAQRRCEEARQAGDLTTALETLRTMIEIDPSRVDLRQAFIETAIEDGLSPDVFREVLAIIDAWIDAAEFGLAREALDLLAHYLPAEITIHQRLWRIAQAQGDQQGARTTALRLANLCRQAGNPNESVFYLESLPRDTSTPEHVEMLATCQFEAGQVDKAVETLVGLARHYDAAGAWASSDPLYARLATWQPQEPRWIARQAKCKQQQGDTAGALALFEQAGMDFLTAGRLEEAAEVWTEALSIDPAAIDIAQAQYALLRRLGREQEARRLSSSTVNYLKLNRGARAAAEFLAGCAGAEDVTIDTSLALADLWTQADDKAQAVAEIRRALARARREGDQEALSRLAQRWLAHEPDNTEALEVLASVGTVAQSGPERRRLLNQLGETYMAHGDWDRAAGVFQQLHELDPDDTRFHERLITCQEKRGDLDQVHRLRFHLAERLFARQQWAACKAALLPLMAEPHPEPVVRNLLLQCHLQLRDLDAAAHLGAALCDDLCADGDLEGAVTVAEQVLALAPNDSAWRRRLLSLQRTAGRTADATQTARGLLAQACEARDGIAVSEFATLLRDLAPRDRAVRAEIAEALRQIGDEEALRHEQLALAALHREAGDDAQAQTILEELLAADPESKEVLHALLDLLIARGDAHGAATLLWERAMTFAEREDLAEAIDALNQLLEIDPTHLEARRRLADLLRSLMRNDEAVEQLAVLAQLLADSGDLTQAIATWQEVVALRPEVIPYHQALITCQLTAGGGPEMQRHVDEFMQSLLRRGALDEALACLDRFEQFDAELPLWHRWRGEIHSQRGEADKAIEAFRRFSALVNRHISARAGRDLGPGGASAQPEGSGLSPDHTFESYIVGDRNSFACATARAVAENPSKAYNPLFIYSDVGLGKTHLLCAIGNHIRRHQPKLRVLYITVEDFISGLVDAIQRNQVNEFRARHRHIDVLLVDDVQFLAGKERAQEEFFHLFNTLHQAKKQIVVTSDRPPREMLHLEKRLRSRFGAGVIVDIQPPDLETRMAIVRQAARDATGGALSDEVINLVAERCTSNIRELKGALMQLVAIAATRKSPLTAEEAADVLDQILERVS